MEEAIFKFLIFDKYPEIIHGVSGRSYGDMKFTENQEEIIKNRQQFFRNLGIDASRAVFAEQIHGSKITLLGKNEAGRGSLSLETKIPGVDALMTGEKGIFLATLVADCLPILIYDPISEVIGIAHAGWRGLIQQIVPKITTKFQVLNSQPENLIIGIGPAICQKHFVVKGDVLKSFKDLYPKATLVRNHDGYVDLKKVATSDFKKMGIPTSNIETALECTFCDNGVYSSFRKEGNGVPEMMAVIGMRE